MIVKFSSSLIRMAFMSSSRQYHQLSNRFIIKPVTSNLLNQNNVFKIPKYSFSDAGQTDTMKIFEKAKPLITDQLKKEINATMVFCISGKNYLLEATADKPLRMELVDEPPKCDVTMIADEKTFMKLAKGEMKSTVAFMSGKLKIKGNVQLAMKAEKMFKALQKEGGL